MLVTAFGGSAVVVGTGVFGASAGGAIGCVVFPSTPLFGSGAGPGIPLAVGVWALDVTGCVIAGGAFR